LKPENLLLDFDNNIKLVDFGLSNTYKEGETLKTACGSPCYAAPEMIEGKRYFGTNVDIWSSGVILFAMICGFLPFEDPNTSSLYKKILSADYKIPKFVSKDAADILKNILNTDADKRFTIEQIRNHPWYKQVPEVFYRGIFVGKDQIPVED
jgi:5'-AMP-activated protein kinase, catalytic alpha subunit